MNVSPAPWQLTGEGFIVVYKFSLDFIEKFGFLDGYQKKYWNGGLGTLMCVKYQSSNVGPYQELLFIPGRITLKNFNSVKIKSGFTISKIYVSTQDSVENGISNWGIPKELADFQWIEIDKYSTQIKVSVNGNEFFNAEFKKRHLKIPINTSFIPLKIIQKKGNQFFLTKPTAKGKSCFVKVNTIKADADFFPKIGLQKPLLAVNISNFEMVFPIPTIENINE